jgi:hypothetical protein
MTEKEESTKAVSVSLDAFVRVLVVELVDDTVEHYEATRAYWSSSPAAPKRLTYGDEGKTSTGSADSGAHPNGDGSIDRVIDRMIDRVPALHAPIDAPIDQPCADSRGVSPENADLVEAVTADAAQAVGVAVRGLLGLWKLSDDYGSADGKSANAKRANRKSAGVHVAPLVSGVLSVAPSSGGSTLTSVKRRASRFDPLRIYDEEQNVLDHRGSVEKKYSVVSPRDGSDGCVSSVSRTSRCRRSPRVVFDRSRGVTMILLDKGVEDVYVSLAEYVDFVDKAAATNV